MEEFYPQQTNCKEKISVNLQCQPTQIQHQMANTRHLSVLGMEFQNKVALFQRSHCSTIIQQLNADSLSPEDVFQKVYSFLESLIVNPKLHHELTQIFRILEEETDSQSQGSISNNSIDSNNLIQQNLLRNKSSCKNQILTEIPLNSCKINQKESQQLGKVRPSMMRKSNRISIADSINMSELHECLKEITPLPQIDSSNSLDQDDKPFEFQTKRLLKFQSQCSVECQSNKQNSFKVPHAKIERQKKVSIMLMMEDCDDNFGSSDSFFSEQETFSLSELAPQYFPFSMEVVQTIFDDPEPFLINLTICLLVKCMAHGQINLTSKNTSWMLGIAYIVACKIYYDEHLEGIMDYFSQILGITKCNVIHLERWFLQQLNYQVSINCQEYQQIMFRLINQS